MRTRLVLVCAVLVTLAGCGGAESSSSSTAVSSETVNSHPGPAPAGNTEVSTSSGPKSGELTGFGASDAAWNATHTEDTQFSPGSNYNVNTSLPEVGGHPGVEYQTVGHEDGRVLNYTYHFGSEPISQAKANVMSTQFPRDARIVWFSTKGTCAQMLVQSNLLREALSSKAIGDTEGTALVEFGTESSGGEESYDASAVTNALMMLFGGANPSGPSTAPGC
jgi:hypothetical protein